MKCYIIEEHHRALALWASEFRERPPASGLLHVDAHADISPPVTADPLDWQRLQTLPPTELLQFIDQQIHIADFILAGVICGFFSQIFWLRPDFVGYNNCWRETLSYRSIADHATDFILKTTEKKVLTTADYTLPFPASAKDSLYYYGFQQSSSPTIPQGVILDIELDFFSCFKRPSVADKIEISKEAYNNYNSSPYHFLKFHHNTSCEEIDGRYFLVFNPWHRERFIQGGSTPLELRHRVKNFLSWLEVQNLCPSLISISRAVKSGFTPVAYAEYLEELLKEGLQKLYNCTFTDFF